MVTVPPPPTVSISAIVNAASYAGGGVAPGEIVTLVGSGIGPDALQTYQIQNGQFATKVMKRSFYCVSKHDTSSLACRTAQSEGGVAIHSPKLSTKS